MWVPGRIFFWRIDGWKGQGHSGFESQTCLFLHNVEIKAQLLTANDAVEVKLPKLPRKPPCGPALVEIYHEFQAKRAPEIGQRDINPPWLQPHFRVERKELPVIDEAIERVTVEMIAMGRISRPVRV